MPEPNLTAGERALLSAVVASVQSAQSAELALGRRCIQARSGRDAEFVACGLSGSQISTARAAGVTADVDEYEGPAGRGWQLRVRLVRDGVTWERVIHSGPETWREQTWHVVPEMV